MPRPQLAEVRRYFDDAARLAVEFRALYAPSRQEVAAMRFQIRTLQQEVRELRQKEQASLRECDALKELVRTLQSGTAMVKAEVALPQIQDCEAASGSSNTEHEVVHFMAPFKSDHRYDAIGRVVVEDGVVRMQTKDEVTVASTVTDASSSGATLPDHSVPRSVDALLDMDDEALKVSGLTAQVEIRALVRSMPLDRALSAVLPLGRDDNDPCSGIFDMSDLAVDLVMTRASPIIGALLKRRINSARMFASAASQQVNEGKFSFSLVGGNMDDFKAGVTGRVGEPRDDLEKGMEMEHTCEADSDIPFRSSNYGILTSPRIEYRTVISGGTDVTTFAMRGRVLRPLEYYGTFSDDGTLMDSPLVIVKKAGLSRGEVVAIIMYTGPAYQLYNGIIRRFGDCGVVEEGVPPVTVVDRCMKSGNNFSSTIHLIVSAVEKLRLAQGMLSGTWLFRGLSGGELPSEFWEKGFSEFAFMSMTRKLEVAIDYSGIVQGKKATVLATQSSEVDKGAFLQEFSQFPGEEECLFNPSCYVERQVGMDELRETPYGMVKIIHVKINANQRALTSSELQARRKKVVVNMAETLAKDSIYYVNELKKTRAFKERVVKDRKHWPRHGEAFLSSIVAGIHERVHVLQNRPVQWYLTDKGMRQAVNEAAEIPDLAKSKLHFWLDDISNNVAQSLVDLSLENLRRRMVGERRRRIAAARDEGDLELLRKLALKECIDKGYVGLSVEEFDEQGETGLIRMCAESDDAASYLLLEAGADARARSKTDPRAKIDTADKTALHWAATNAMPETAQRLIRSNADVDAQDCYRQTPLYIAAKNHDHIMVEVLLKSKANTEIKDDGDWSPLHAAASAGNMKILGSLLQAKADYTAGTLGKRTPLHMASSHGHATAVSALISAGSNVDAKDGKQRTALIVAAECGYLAVVQTLVSAGADLEARQDQQRTALFLAVIRSNTEVMEVLISAGAQLECPDVDGLYPIHRAARLGTQPEILEMMLRAKACVHLRDSAGRGALHHAAKTDGGENLVKMLIEASAAVDVNALDENGCSALHVASSAPQCKFMLALIDAGADIEVTGEGGRTPLLQALFCEKPTLIESVKLLITAKANIEARGGDGSEDSSKTALHFACLEDSSVMRVLLEANADVNAVEELGNTALHLASSWDCSDCVKLLCAAGADVNAINNSGCTSLIEASHWGGSLECARLLVEFKADLHVTGKDGLNACDWAQQRSLADLVSFLEEKMAE